MHHEHSENEKQRYVLRCRRLTIRCFGFDLPRFVSIHVEIAVFIGPNIPTSNSCKRCEVCALEVEYCCAYNVR
jgi:hypothetical protein